MTRVIEAAKDGLSGRTGFVAPRVVSVKLEDGLYHVILDVLEPGAGLLRTYDVAVDPSGDMHGYAPLASGPVSE